jgi:hypothetical protein
VFRASLLKINESTQGKEMKRPKEFLLNKNKSPTFY